MKILNLTQHEATKDQIDAGVVEPPDKMEVQRLLTFNDRPTPDLVIARARALADLARNFFGPQSEEAGYPDVMIGGAPFLMAPLERALARVQIHPNYSFSTRESVDQLQPDGTVRKIESFKHAGFFFAVQDWEDPQ